MSNSKIILHSVQNSSKKFSMLSFTYLETSLDFKWFLIMEKKWWLDVLSLYYSSSVDLSLISFSLVEAKWILFTVENVNNIFPGSNTNSDYL